MDLKLPLLKLFRSKNHGQRRTYFAPGANYVLAPRFVFLPLNRLVEDYRNRLDFFIRRKIHISRKRYKETGTTEQEVTARFLKKNVKKVQHIINRYSLTRYFEYLSWKTIVDNVRHLELLEKSGLNRHDFKRPLKILDVGSKRFSYCIALKEFFLLFGQAAESSSIIGVEVDGNRPYSNFYSNRECAVYYMQVACDMQIASINFTNLASNLEGNRSTTKFQYVNLDIKEFESEYKFDVITVFDPFVTSGPLINWGLPLSFFGPNSFFEKIKQLLQPTGTLIVSNLSKEEFEITTNILQKIGLRLESALPIKDNLGERDEVFVIRAKLS